MKSSLEAIRLEVSDYLEKPLCLESVRDAIARGIKKRETMRQTIENKVHQKFLSDSLTGLPDRSFFLNRLKRTIVGNDGLGNRSFAVLLIDIDHFKGINDTFGHRIGDMVLSELSKRFVSSVRTTDTVARMNGDEFAVLMEDCESREMLMAVAERCQKAAEKIICIEETKMNLSVSIGIVAKTLFYKSPDDVLRDAELALSRCKKQGGGLIKVFDTDMLEQAIESLQLENDLRLGIQNQEYTLQYQPIIRLEDMRVVGLEALIRWNHPDHGLMYPDDFVPKAEEIGLINQIGNWVVNEGCRQLKEWQRTLAGFDGIKLSVNVSSQQFLQPGFADNIAGILGKYDLDPGTLKFEITESVLMENSETSIKTLSAMKAIGLNLVIDDFGTGYSSFAYLQQFPLDDLKIGKYFIQKLHADTETYEIVKSISGLAKKLGLNVVAEGVESEDHFNQVKKLNFDMVQGFWLAKPADPATIANDFLKTTNKPEKVIF